MEKQHEMEIVEQAFTLLDKEELTDAIVDEVFGLLGKVFDEDCLKQIQWGFENGLTPEQVGVYAKSEFTREQMEQIRVGVENRLSMEQVSMYAKPEFTYGQMVAIRLGFEKRLSMEQVSVYAKREFIEQQMHEIRVGFENGLSMEQVAVFVKPEFGWYQMQTIRRGFEADLSMEQVSVYAKPEFTGEQMRQIRLGFEKGLSMEQVEVFARQEFTDSQMEEIRLGFEHGLTPEQVSMYAKPELTAKQMEELREGFEQKLRKSSLVEKIMTAKKEQGQAVSKEPEKSRERAGVMRNWRNKNRIKGEIMNVLFFTGAGISKDSGVPTFQEIDGIRTKLRRKYAALHPAEIRDMMREFKGFMKDKEPNAAHVAIAKTGFPVITMNVDELHQRAGSKDVLAIHGDIPSEEELGKWYYPYLPLGKPVLYGDIAPRYYKAFAKLRSLREGDYLVIVGTSFYTNISKDIRKMAEKRGAKVISINENATVEVPRVCEELLRKVEEGGKSYGTRNKKCI